MIYGDRISSGDRRIEILDLSKGIGSVTSREVPELENEVGVSPGTEISGEVLQYERECFFGDFARSESGNFIIQKGGVSSHMEVPPEFFLGLESICLYIDLAGKKYAISSSERLRFFNFDGTFLSSIDVSAGGGLGSFEALSGRQVFIAGNEVLVSYRGVLSKIYSGSAAIGAAVLSPNGKRLALAFVSGYPAVDYELYSIESQQHWRSLGGVHRWYSLGFLEDNLVLTGHDPVIVSHRIMGFQELKAVAEELLR